MVNDIFSTRNTYIRAEIRSHPNRFSDFWFYFITYGSSSLSPSEKKSFELLDLLRGWGGARRSYRSVNMNTQNSFEI